ncbi:MAG: SLC13 family permease [Gammaproteobacteria bacterium]|nr:SLC13 family permease [Gammaproteobacteria bacterium]
MIWEAWLTVAVLVGVFGVLVATRAAADIVFLGGLAVLVVTGVVSPREAFGGLANEGLITLAVLYVVVVGLQETGGIRWIGRSLLGRPRSLSHAQVRVMTPVAFLSMFLNNTPVVAMLIPAVRDWARQYDLAPSRLMIPLSYAAILGGTCTLIGTSTNLVVNGLLIEHSGGGGLMMFDLAWVGIPIALAGGVFLLLTSHWLLPDRRPVITQFDDPREYSVEMVVDEGGPLVGRSIDDAGLRQLPGVFLAEIDRDGGVLPAVSPREVLQAGDQLVFAGAPESVVELQKIRGLRPATNQLFKIKGPRSERALYEAVVSATAPVVGRTIRRGRFRVLYNAVIIAVARSGRRLRGKVGDIVLREGDTLLIEARPSFYEQQRSNRDFLTISRLDDSTPPRHERAPVAIGLLAAMVLVVSFGLLSMLEAALLAAAGMLATRCCTPSGARDGIDWSVLLTIAAAFGMGTALEVTGVAAVSAHAVIGFVGDNPWANLAAIYVMTTLLSAVITNNAAAVLMFPFALAVSGDLDVSVIPYVITVMMAASASFATPISYQTNLMVMGPGGYHFTDFFRVGLPLNLLTAMLAIGLIPLVWRF